MLMELLDTAPQVVDSKQAGSALPASRGRYVWVPRRKRSFSAFEAKAEPGALRARGFVSASGPLRADLHWVELTLSEQELVVLTELVAQAPIVIY